jgi:hypothetical protein
MAGNRRYHLTMTNPTPPHAPIAERYDVRQETAFLRGLVRDLRGLLVG